MNIQIIQIIFIKTLKNTIQIRNKILLVFDDLIADMLNNKKLNPIVTELFIRGRNLNIFLVFITQPYFTVPKNIRLNYMHSVIMKIAKKKITSTNCV